MNSFVVDRCSMNLNWFSDILTICLNRYSITLNCATKKYLKFNKNNKMIIK